MDFQTFNQVHDSNSRRVIGLRIPKEFDLNLVPETTESDDEFPVSQVEINSSQASQNPTEEVNTVSNGLGAGDPALPSNPPNNTTSMQPLYSSHDNRRRVDPAGNGNSLDCDTGRTLCPLRLEVNDSDRRRVCTNYHCRTRNTPMWRKGPLGPKTLCNACGIQYKKQVASRGSNR